HVVSIADPGRLVPDHSRPNAIFFEVVEATDAGPVAPEAGIVEDDSAAFSGKRQITRIDPAMRRRHNHEALVFTRQFRDRVAYQNAWREVLHQLILAG